MTTGDGRQKSTYDRGNFLKKSGLVLAGASLGGSLGGPAFARDRVFRQAREKVTLRLDWTAEGYHAQFWSALDRGFWRAEGLDVEIRDGSGSGDAIKAIISGQDTFAHADRSTMILAAAQGAPVLSVAGIGAKSGLAFGALKSANIRRPADLRGKTVLTTLGGSDGPLVPAFLKANNIPESAVKIQGVAPAAKVSLLLDGKADAITLVINGVGSILAAQAPTDFILWANHGLPTVSYGIVTGRSVDPAIVRKFLRGAVRGATFAKDNPRKAIEHFRRHNPSFDADVGWRQLAGWRPLIHSEHTRGRPIGYQAPEDWNKTIAIFEDVGLIKSGSVPKGYPNKFYTNGLLPKPKKKRTG